MTGLTIDGDYGYVLMAATGIAFQCMLTGMGVAPVRYRVFSEDFVKKNLSAESDELKKFNGKGIGKGCHPDPGLGRFADKLPLEHWYELNVAQRVHGNFLESIAIVITTLLIAGLFLSKIVGGLGLLYIIGRYLYASGFKSTTGGSRVKGFMLFMLVQLCLFGISFLGGLQMTGLVDGFLPAALRLV